MRWVDQPRRLISRIALPPARATSANASRVRGCSGPRIAPRMSTISTGGSGRPSTRLGSSSRSSSCQLSGRGVAVRRAAPRRLGGPPAGDLAGVVARVALLLVGGVVLLVDHDQAEIGDRSEDGRARPDADPRLAGAQAAPLVVAGAGGHPGVEQRDRVAEAAPEAVHRLRRQRDLGTSTIAPRPAPAPPGPPRGTPRSCPSRSRRGAGRRRRALARRAPRPLASERRALVGRRARRPRAPRRPPGDACRRRRSTSRVSTRPRDSSRRSVARSRPAVAASSAARAAGPRRSARSTARWRSPSRSPPATASSPSAVASPPARPAAGPRRASAPVPTPGGSTRPRPRAGVEQYSSPTQRPSSTSSGGTPASSASSGSARRPAGSSLRSARPTTTPTTRRRPKGTTSTEPTPTSSIASGRR